ncbi:MAG: hypothetical protein AB1349_11745 [Elusimicrobiota bacterium]
MKTLKIAKCLLTIILVLTLFIKILHAFPFEKGDLIFREKDYPIPEIPEWFSHTGIYYKYVGSGDPLDKTNHLVVESIKSDDEHNHGRDGVVMHTFDYFYNKTTFLDGKSRNPSYISRNIIIQTALSKIGCHWDLIEYKGPNQFRCDGLGEFCYESVGIDIVPEGFYLDLWPDKQRSSMANSIGISPTVTITDSNGKVLQNGDVTNQTSVSIYATDGNNGSGLSLLQYWRTPTGTIEPIYKITDNYDLDHTYSLTNLADGQWNIEVYDQAGNVALHILAFDFYYFSDDTRNLRFAKTYYSKQRISDYV